MTDEELVKRLRDYEEFEQGRDGQIVCQKSEIAVEAADRIEALTEQLEAARADAKEAEAYAEELERDLKTCRMAQAVMDNTVAELEKERDHWQDVAGREGVCMTCCGPRGAPEPYGCSD
jgi:microcystin degradation protein MlrC